MFEGFFYAYFAGIERCQLRYDHQHAENPGFTEWYQNEHYSNTALCWLSEVGFSWQRNEAITISGLLSPL